MWGRLKNLLHQILAVFGHFAPNLSRRRLALAASPAASGRDWGLASRPKAGTGRDWGLEPLPEAGTGWDWRLESLAYDQDWDLLPALEVWTSVPSPGLCVARAYLSLPPFAL